MFDVGFNELLLIAVIGLLVLGPERLPKVAAQVGRWVARARRTATQLRQELEREVALSEIAKAEKRGDEQSQAGPAEDEESEHEETAANDYEADLYATTHEGLGADTGVRPNGADSAENGAAEREPRGHDDAGEPESGGTAARQSDTWNETEPQPGAEPRPAAPEHPQAAGEEPQEPQDKTPPAE